MAVLEQSNNCPFCEVIKQKSWIMESTHFFAIYDKYPVNLGHLLVIPKRHVSDYFELSKEELDDCLSFLERGKNLLNDKFNPDGFNIGINIGKSAGQTIFHVHIHLIPRYKNDVEDPTGGVRGVIPSKQKY